MTVLSTDICAHKHTGGDYDVFELPFFGGISFSTYLFRSLSSGAHNCNIGEGPCQIYVTLPQDSSNSLFINYHLPFDECEKNQCFP